MLYYNKSVADTLKELGSTTQGLPASEAQERLKLHGPNTIKVTGDPLWRKLLEPFANVFIAVLLLAVIISLFQRAYLDAVIIGIIIAVSAIIYYVQRFSTERILRSLRQHTKQTVLVIRDGKDISLETQFIVPGDIILLREGDKIPADARIIEAQSLRIDESQLTGESLPVNKNEEALRGKKEVYEQSNMLYHGSFTVAGEAYAVITATGNETEFGHLAALTKDINEQSPVQKKIDTLISQIIAIVAGIALVAFALALFRGMDISESIRFVLALSVSAVPESLPIAISIIMVLGMRRMAAKKALVRTMRAIESIGVITTIATDKTGTLTRNKLTVQELWQLPHNKSNLAELLLKSANQSGQNTHDPLDTALISYAHDNGARSVVSKPVRSLPFDQKSAMSGNLWHHGSTFELAIKGAPEHVLLRCDLTEGEHEIATAQLHTLTANGYRVLAVAQATLTKNIEDFSELPKKQKLTFAGFVAVADVLRPEAKAAIRAAQTAGVTVRMITGDHFETAYHIGRQLGMVANRSQVFDARRMSTMSDSELEKIIDKTYIFSRVLPEYKYRILSLLKKKHITAMTGDGVNDVPALVSAHVGIAMGSGASIAKDAGDIILLDNNFKSIVDAMREGRVIFSNIQRMLFYLLSTNASEVLVVLAALIIGIPIPLLPVQLLWINLATDTPLVIPLGLEPGEKNAMKLPPNAPNSPLLTPFIISRMVLIAITMAGVTLAVYIAFSTLQNQAYAGTIAFNALVAMQWANAFCSRSDSESIFTRITVINKAFYVGLAIAILLHLLALFSPLSQLLHISPVSIGDLVFSGMIGLATPIVISEVHKYIGRRIAHKIEKPAV